MKSLSFVYVLLLLISLSNSISSLAFSKMSAKDKDKSTTSKLTQSRESLGRHMWISLHTFAAAYPDHPTDEDKMALRSLFSTISIIYPCIECKEHFGKMIKENPIVDESKEEVVAYICKLHNIVNERLEKPQFDCRKAFLYWQGDCGCGNKNKEEDH